jgi:hypothetical protein
MSHNSIAFAGMNRADEEEIRSIFDRANAANGGMFKAVSEDSADVLVVDVDSIHGHMTWMRVHNDRDRIVVAVSSREAPHADHCLVRPVTVESLSAVLDAIIAGGLATAGAADVDSDTGQTPAEPMPAAEAAPQHEPDASTAPQSRSEPESASVGASEPELESLSEPGASPAPAAPPPPPARRRLADYLAPGALPGPSRLAFAGAPELVVDPGARVYLGPAQLKGFAPYAQADEITPELWQPISADELAGMVGTRQPWGRLAWLSGLYRSPGELAPGYALDDRFVLLKWPQIEREFPRHFRIATAMMKAPATAGEIAEASGAPQGEVIDFINASIAAGQVERVVEEAAAEDAPAKGGGLLGRLKGLRGN